MDKASNRVSTVRSIGKENGELLVAEKGEVRDCLYIYKSTGPDRMHLSVLSMLAGLTTKHFLSSLKGHWDQGKSRCLEKGNYFAHVRTGQKESDETSLSASIHFPMRVKKSPQESY